MIVDDSEEDDDSEDDEEDGIEITIDKENFHQS